MDDEKAPAIFMIGIGTGGCNIVENVIGNIDCCNMDAVCLDTDEMSLKNRSRCRSVLLDMEKIKYEDSLEKLFSGKVKTVVIVACLGGKTGSNVVCSAASIAKARNIQTVCIVVTPFGFESEQMAINAREAINGLEYCAVSLYVLNNDDLVRNSGLSFSEAFGKVDTAVADIVRGVVGA